MSRGPLGSSPCADAHRPGGRCGGVRPHLWSRLLNSPTIERDHVDAGCCGDEKLMRLVTSGECGCWGFLRTEGSRVTEPNRTLHSIETGRDLFHRCSADDKGAELGVDYFEE